MATANRWNIPYKNGDPTILLTASGERMPVDGSAKIKARANGINVSMDVLVSDAIQDEMLVSYKAVSYTHLTLPTILLV